MCGFNSSVSKESPCNAGDLGSISGFDFWVRKILWRRKWQPTPVSLPGESHGQKSLVGFSPWGCKSWTRLSDFTTTTTNHGIAFPRIMCLTQEELQREATGVGDNNFLFFLFILAFITPSLNHFIANSWVCLGKRVMGGE